MWKWRESQSSMRHEWAMRAIRAWGFTWDFSKCGELVNGTSKGSCGVVQAVIAIFGKNEAMRHFEMAHRIVFNKQGCQSLSKGLLLLASQRKTHQRGDHLGGFHEICLQDKHYFCSHSID